jgi:hypothetical protein
MNLTGVYTGYFVKLYCTWVVLIFTYTKKRMFAKRWKDTITKMLHNERTTTAKNMGILKYYPTSHKLWKRLAPGMPGRVPWNQTRPPIRPGASEHQVCNLPGSCVLSDGTYYRYWTGQCYCPVGSTLSWSAEFKHRKISAHAVHIWGDWQHLKGHIVTLTTINNEMKQCNQSYWRP